MKIETKDILNKWKQFTLTNNSGMRVSFLDYGGIITEISVPNKQGRLENIVLAYEDYTEYERNQNFLGSLVGPVAGRIENASFHLNETEYKLEKNEGEHHLHGGSHGFHQVIWQASPFEKEDTVGVVLSHQSKESDTGYPGNLDITVTYSLDESAFSIDYQVTTDQDTIVSLTNHSYFNLTGNMAETIHSHHVSIDSDQFVELDKALIPTGELLSVDHTAFDFRHGRKLNDGIISLDMQNIIASNGYDHYFIFNDEKDEQVIVTEKTSGRKLTISTDQPGMVMYTANALTEGLDLVGGKSTAYAGVCFETQASPASLHHSGFPSVILKANETYKKKTTFTFGIQ